MGLFRDDTDWLDENHSLEFYKLQDGVCFLSLNFSLAPALALALLFSHEQHLTSD